MIDDFAIDFFRHSLIEAAIGRLHVEHRYLASLSGYDREASIGVTIDENRVRLLPLKNLIGGNDDFANCLGGRRTACIQKNIRLSNAQFLKEDLVQLKIKVLTRMQEDMVCMSIKLGNDATELDELWACPDDCHHLLAALLDRVRSPKSPFFRAAGSRIANSERHASRTGPHADNSTR
jgi:hypothetical protein